MANRETDIQRRKRIAREAWERAGAVIDKRLQAKSEPKKAQNQHETGNKEVSEKELSEETPADPEPKEPDDERHTD